ncbi:hypothetical protein U1Q18_032454 [Sarracenia purpurea var. burkii]
MALEGLFPSKDQRGAVNDHNNLTYPKLEAMLDYILTQQPELLDSTEIRGTKLLFPSKTYAAMIKFLLMCFEADVEQYRKGERTSEYWPSVEKMCMLLEHAMAYEGSVELHSNASEALITIGSHFPEVNSGMIASRYATRILWLKQLLGHMDINTRESAARLLGIASDALPISALHDLISELISSVAGAQKLRFVLSP